MHSTSIGEDEETHIATINIIPLVDVVLVLLIIFMVTTAFSKDSALKLDLPKGSRAEQVKQPPTEISVSVDKKQQIYINGKPIVLQNLATEVEARRNKTNKTILVLRGDKDVVYGAIMPVLDEISHTGVDLTLALEPGTKK